MADTDDIVIDGGPTASPQDAALDALARSEDATAYIEQRQDDLREEQGLAPQTPADERQNRIDEALARARQDTAEARQTNGNGLDLDAQYRDAQAEWQAQQQQELQAAQQQQQVQNYYEARGKCMALNQRLKEMNPQAHTKISECDGTTMSDKLDIIMKASPQEILNAAAQQAANWQQERYVQTRILQDRVAQGRRVTNAPPPITPPRGSANVPRDIHQLASKSDQCKTSTTSLSRRCQMMLS
jgi:hypothetical protein